MNDYKDHTRHIKAASSGQWAGIIGSLSPSAQPAIDRLGRHVACPVHGGTDGFRLFKDFHDSGGGICNTCGSFPDGFALLGWLNGWDFKTTIEEVSQWHGMNLHRRHLNESQRAMVASRLATLQHGDNQHAQICAPAASPKANNSPARRERLKAVWSEAMPINWLENSPASRYLKFRGLSAILTDPPDNLRLHAGLGYWKAGDTGTVCLGLYPTLLAKVQNGEGEPVSIHRTYLDKSGKKADVPQQKKLMQAVTDGATRGGAIRLYEGSDSLCIAEGIETALAIRAALHEPVWATVSAGGMAALGLPPNIKTVSIYADHDTSGAGQQAANTLAERLSREGRRVDIALPPQPGMDWLDVLNSREVAA